MNLIVDKPKYSNCLFEAIRYKWKTHGKIYSLDRFYQNTLYNALRRDGEETNILTKHYFVATPDFENGEMGYIYQFKSAKTRVRFPFLFKGSITAMYKDDGFNTMLFNLAWAMNKLGYSTEEIKGKILDYENKWHYKSTLGNLICRGIKKDLEQTYREAYPSLIADLEAIKLTIVTVS